jgi:hypothetical protein
MGLCHNFTSGCKQMAELLGTRCALQAVASLCSGVRIFHSAPPGYGICFPASSSCGNESYPAGRRCRRSGPKGYPLGAENDGTGINGSIEFSRPSPMLGGLVGPTVSLDVYRLTRRGILFCTRSCVGQRHIGAQPDIHGIR